MTSNKKPTLRLPAPLQLKKNKWDKPAGKTKRQAQKLVEESLLRFPYTAATVTNIAGHMDEGWIPSTHCYPLLWLYDKHQKVKRKITFISFLFTPVHFLHT